MFLGLLGSTIWVCTGQFCLGCVAQSKDSGDGPVDKVLVQE